MCYHQPGVFQPKVSTKLGYCLIALSRRTIHSYRLLVAENSFTGPFENIRNIYKVLAITE